MNKLGFRLVELKLTGDNVQDATIHFKKGLNVISGPSDTGKSFILQCIDFALGKSTPPKIIDEAVDYTTVSLTIMTYQSHSKYILTRRFDRAKSINVTDGKGSIQTLQLQNSKYIEKTISHFLLKLSNLENKRIRKNQDGVTINLSFRDLTRLCIISETEIIKENSPVETGQYTKPTSERSVFKLLLSGVDDSAVEDISVDKISKARVESQNTLLEQLIKKATQEYMLFAIQGDYQELLEQQKSLDESIHRTVESLDVLQVNINDQEVTRKNLWGDLRKTESKLKALLEIKSRFNILEKQYLSDINRLEAMSEVGVKLLNINPEYCSICGALSVYYNPEKQKAWVNPDKITQSCASEINKIRNLLQGLKDTQIDVDSQIMQKEKEEYLVKTKLNAVIKNIQEVLNPKIKQLIHEQSEKLKKKYAIAKALDLHNHITNLKELVQDVPQKESIDLKTSNNEILDYKNVKDFSAEVRKRLKAWHLFPRCDDVIFKEEGYWDIFVSKKPRMSHGKGVRALMHTAFSLGLLSYCITKKMPHPGFVILDSPLVVYREPDKNEEGFSIDVQSAFYSDLATSFADAQVIIIENTTPTAELVSRGNINLISFSKSNISRYGFIPTENNI